MLTLSFDLREYFHLNLLRHIALRLSGRGYALKGGICLRFFHRSPRLSEDMDLDISPQVQRHTLENAVDSIVQNQSFLGSFIPRGVEDIKVSKQKQTETTQRWKFSLILNDGISLPTKVEFSRRERTLSFSRGIPSAEILSHHKMIPFAAQYYDPLSMAAQKVFALSSPTRNAARDLFDLLHLFNTLSVRPEEVAEKIGKHQDKIASSVDKVSRFSFQDFKEQVLPFLTVEIRALYKDQSDFENIKSEVEALLIGMLR